MSQFCRVISEHLATMLARMSFIDVVHLLMMSPLHPLVKSLATDTAGFQLQFYIVRVEMLHQIYGHGVGLHFYHLMADFTLSPRIVLRKTFKMLPNFFSPFLPHFRRCILFYKTSLRIQNWLLFQFDFVRPLRGGALPGNGLEDDGVGDLQMLDHGGGALVVVAHALLADLAHTLGGVGRVHVVILPHLAALRPRPAGGLRDAAAAVAEVDLQRLGPVLDTLHPHHLLAAVADGGQRVRGVRREVVPHLAALPSLSAPTTELWRLPAMFLLHGRFYLRLHLFFITVTTIETF